MLPAKPSRPPNGSYDGSNSMDLASIFALELMVPEAVIGCWNVVCAWIVNGLLPFRWLNEPVSAIIVPL